MITLKWGPPGPSGMLAFTGRDSYRDAARLDYMSQLLQKPRVVNLNPSKLSLTIAAIIKSM